MTGTRLNAPNGRIELHAVTGTGAVALRGATPPGAPAAALGTLTLSASQLLTTGGGTGGGGGGGGGGAGGGSTVADVLIRAGQFVMRSATRIATSTNGANGANGDVRIDVTSARLTGGSQIRVGTSGANRGGRATVNATTSVTIEGNPAVSGGGGAGGGGGGGGGGAGGSSAPSTASGIFSEVGATSTGTGGAIEITAPDVRIADRAELAAGTAGAGNAGAINVRATQRITVTQEAQVDASTNRAGRGGNIRLEAPRVEALNSARLGSAAQDSGPGGTLSSLHQKLSSQPVPTA